MRNLVVYLWGFGSRWVGTNAWCTMDSGYLNFFWVPLYYLPTLKALALVRCGGGNRVG